MSQNRRSTLGYADGPVETCDARESNTRENHPTSMVMLTERADDVAARVSFLSSRLRNFAHRMLGAPATPDAPELVWAGDIDEGALRTLEATLKQIHQQLDDLNNTLNRLDTI
jgi:hypothetical protein